MSRITAVLMQHIPQDYTDLACACGEFFGPPEDWAEHVESQLRQFAEVR